MAKEAAYERGVLRARLARYHGDNVDVAFWGWNREAWLDPDFRELAASTMRWRGVRGADPGHAGA